MKKAFLGTIGGCLGVILVFNVITAIGYFSAPKETQKLYKETYIATPLPIITLSEFNQIKEKMSYEKVVDIIGAEGEVISETSIGGITTIMYKWENGGINGNMMAMFQNDKLINKSQFGLK